MTNNCGVLSKRFGWAIAGMLACEPPTVNKSFHQTASAGDTPPVKDCDQHPPRSNAEDIEAAKHDGGLLYQYWARSHEAGERDEGLPLSVDVGGNNCDDEVLSATFAVGAIVRGGKPHCTGTLIGPNTVLTAAHCVHDADVLRMEFRLGSDAAAPSEVIPILDAKAHPKYAPDIVGVHDLGVLYLKHVPLSAFPLRTRQAPLARTTAAATRLSSLFVGFGAGIGGAPGPKRCVVIPITDICRDSFTYGSSGRLNTCHGDSGGPAVQIVGTRAEVVGVTAWGDPSCEKFGVSTDVGAEVETLKAWLVDAPDVSEPKFPVLLLEDPAVQGAPWPPFGGDTTYTVTAADAIRAVDRLVIPAGHRIVFAADVAEVSWSVRRLEFGAGAVIDLSREKAAAGEHGGPPDSQPAHGVAGRSGRPGQPGQPGMSGRSLRLHVERSWKPRGSLWIRTDGGSGGDGGNGGDGQTGGGSSCGRTVVFGPNEPKVNGGRGGDGGARGEGGAGGDTSAVAINLPIKPGPYCMAQCGHSSAPPEMFQDRGQIAVWGAPGCPGAPGVAGKPGLGGERNRSCAVGGDVVRGADGSSPGPSPALYTIGNCRTVTLE